jgi:hypothetical protein
MQRALVASALVTSSTEARADIESWTWVEHRSALARDVAPPSRLALRAFYDLRFTGRHRGIGLAFARVGPLFDATQWLSIGASYAAFTSSDAATRRPFWEQRVEVEATATARVGALVLSHRHRAESRWRAAWHRWRYRVQARVSFTPDRWRVGAFLWDEALIELNLIDARGAQAGALENRAGAGLSFAIDRALRLEVGYVLRARQWSGLWELDHVALTSVSINLAR